MVRGGLVIPEWIRSAARFRALADPSAVVPGLIRPDTTAPARPDQARPRKRATALPAHEPRRGLHRIISMLITSTEEFNTAAIALLVIEYLDR